MAQKEEWDIIGVELSEKDKEKLRIMKQNLDGGRLLIEYIYKKGGGGSDGFKNVLAALGLTYFIHELCIDKHNEK